MNINIKRLVTIVALSLSALTACDSGGAEPVPAGSAPVVEGLSLAQETVPVGEVVQISGQLDFSDADADVTHFAATIAQQGVQPVTLDDTPVQGAAGLSAGTVPFALAIMAPTAGPVAIEVWLVDAAGHTSNVLGAELRAA